MKKFYLKDNNQSSEFKRKKWFKKAGLEIEKTSDLPVGVLGRKI